MELEDVLLKKAMGYMVEEVTFDYERSKVKELLLCKKHSRLYTKNGFIKVKIGGGGKVEVDEKLKNIKFFYSKPKKNCKKGSKNKVFCLKK